MLIRLGFCGCWKLILGKSENIPVAALDRARVGTIRFSHHDTRTAGMLKRVNVLARAGGWSDVRESARLYVLM